MSKAAVGAIRLFEKFASTGLRGKITAKFLSGLLKIIHPRKQVIDDNLKLVFPHSPEQWRNDIRGQVYDNLAWTVTELLALQKNTEQAFKWVKNVHNLELADELLQDKHGVIFLSCHFGNWELLASWYAQYALKHGHKLYAIIQELHDNDISLYIEHMRRNSMIEPIPKNTSVHKFAHMLKNGAHLAVLNDVAGIREVMMPFMGHDATNTPGPAVMAMLSGVPIVPVCIYRDAPFVHEIEFFEPLNMPDKSLSHDERMRAVIMECNNVYENIIRKRPELWFWLHKRWRP